MRDYWERLLATKEEGAIPDEDEVAEIIIAFYKLTGIIQNSSFFGQGKKKVLEKSKETPRHESFCLKWEKI